MLARSLALTLALTASVAAADIHQTSAGAVKVEPVATGLEEPWAVAFLPGEELLITERDGVLLHILPDGTRRAVTGVPEVWASGQGGLLDVALDPAFAENRVIYLSYSEPEGLFSARTAVARARFVEGTLSDVQVIFRQTPAVRGGRHFGSRVVPDGKGHVFITTGDRGERPEAQNPQSHIGKVIRVRDDGTVPADNPFVGGGALPEIWSIGHRNTQGAAMDETGQLWTVAHGARGGDEINRPEPGLNYGWPVISYGVHYSGGTIGEGTRKDGMEQPSWVWDPSIAPSGMAIYSGRLWPDWAGDIFVGSLKFDMVSRLDRNGDRIEGEEVLLRDAYGRIRDVREGPDGALYFLSVVEGALYRMAPAR